MLLLCRVGAGSKPQASSSLQTLPARNGLWGMFHQVSFRSALAIRLATGTIVEIEQEGYHFKLEK